jgi:hypothetical protein
MSNDLVSRNQHDVPIINLWILLLIKHIQHYQITVIMQVIYIYNMLIIMSNSNNSTI